MAGEGLVTSIEGPVDDQELAAWKASVPAQANTLLVLADYACVQITELLNGLQDLFANEVNYFEVVAVQGLESRLASSSLTTESHPVVRWSYRSLQKAA